MTTVVESAIFFAPGVAAFVSLITWRALGRDDDDAAVDVAYATLALYSLRQMRTLTCTTTQ